MDGGLEEVAHKQVDVEFMSTIAQKMAVPRHIRIGQGESYENTVPQYRPSEVVESMNVPERILVAGDNELREERLPRNDSSIGSPNYSHVRNLPVTLQTPPSTLTVQNGFYPTAADELVERHNPKNLMADLDNPGAEGAATLPQTVSGSFNVEQKVALLEKQMTRLNTRLYQLEDELESVQYWQKIQLYLFLGLGAVFVLKYIVNR